MNIIKSRWQKITSVFKKKDPLAKVPLSTGKPLSRVVGKTEKQYKITCAITYKGTPVRKIEFTQTGNSSSHAVTRFEEGIQLKVVSAIQIKKK